METKLGKKEEEAHFFVDRHLAAKKEQKGQHLEKSELSLKQYPTIRRIFSNLVKNDPFLD